MTLLNKLTLKNLKLNRKRTIVTIIGIMLSVALITAVASMYASGISSLISFEKIEQGNFHAVFYNVPEDDIRIFKNNREIESIYPTKGIGYAKLETKNDYKPYAYILGLPKISLENLSINLIEGRLPNNDNEILIPSHLNTNGRVNLKVGDTITLEVGTRIAEDGTILTQDDRFYKEDLIDNIDGEETVLESKSVEEIVDTKTKTYKIVGLIKRPAYNIEGYSAPGYTFITNIKEQEISGNVNLYALYSKDGVKDAYKLTANLLGVDEDIFEKVNNNEVSLEVLEKYDQEMEKVRFKYAINDYLIDLETNPIKGSGIQGLGYVLIVVMIIIVFTSVFCIKNSFDISITEKIKQYGMLRSIGATKKQIKKNVFYEATILGLIGIPLGVVCGFLASFILVIVSNHFLTGMITDNLKLHFTFSWIALIIAIILGIITIYFSAFRSAKRASKISPIDSIRNSANIKINSKKVKSPKIIKKIFGVGGEISYKNLKRNKKKYRTTVISIIVSVFIFIALSSFMGMALKSIEDELNISEYNVMLYVSLTNGDKIDTDKFMETTSLDNIEDYAVIQNDNFNVNNIKYNEEYLKYLGISRDDDNQIYLSVYTLGDYQFKKYVESLGLDYKNMEDKAILLDYSKVLKYDKNDKPIYKYMRIFDNQIGDKLNGVFDFGNDNSKVDIEIGYITDKRPFGLKNNENLKLIISDNLFNQYSKPRNLEFCYQASDANKLQDEIDTLLKGENYDLENLEENARLMKNIFTLIGIFLYGFIIVISLIGITNVFNTITTNMELRQGEFAMLKSIGMTNHEFKRMIRLESLFMGLKSLLFGVPIGIALSYLIYFLQREEIPYYTLPTTAIIISIIVVFILITLIMKYSIRKINKQNTIETIRNENI